MSMQHSQLELARRAIANAGSKLFRVGALSLLLLSGLTIGENAIAKNRGRALAQTAVPEIKSDGTTGTLVSPIPPFPQSPSGGFAITGGAIAGTNLFHSFETFSPETAYTLFNLNDSSYDNINNIFSRVTGTTATHLNGYLQVTGGNRPSLFLLNPNGVLIGPGAAMDIPGSLFVSTAESLSFADNTTFSASDTTPNPLLTISAPVGLQFGSSAAPIAVNGRFTGVQNPQTGQYDFSESFLFRPGSNVTLLGSANEGDGVVVNDAFFNIFSGQMQIGSVGENSSVEIDAESHNLTYASDTEFRDIQINRSLIDVGSVIDGSAGGSGRISLQGRAIDLSSANLTSDNISSEDGGSIELSASKSIEIEDSRVTTALFPGLVFSNPQQPPTLVPSTGAGGSITINTDELVVRPTTKIGADSYSLGDGGDVTITANKASFLGSFDPTLQIPSVRLVSNAFDEGNGGNLIIDADQLEVAGSTFIAASTYSVVDPMNPMGAPAGDGGNVTLNVGDLIVRDWAQIGTGTFGDGDSGNLEINAENFSFYDYTDSTVRHPFAQITTSVFGGSGRGGDLDINVDGVARIAGDVVITASTYPSFGVPGALPSAVDGRGGNLTFKVGSLDLQDGGQIGTGTFGSGDSGSLEIEARTGVNIAGTGTVSTVDRAGNPISVIRSSGIFISTQNGSSGQGGSLTMTTPLLSISRGGKLSAETAGTGDAGSLSIRAGEVAVSDLVVDAFGSPSGIVARVAASSSGNGGTLDITSDRLHVLNGGRITASTDGAGTAGNINIRSGSIEVEGISDDGLFNSTIESRSSTEFGAGSVDLVGDRIRVTDQGTLSVSNLSGGDAGNIRLSANSVYLNNGSISAEASAGNQGNLGIESQNILLLRQGSHLTTNATGTATGGNITLSAPLIVGSENSDISANAVEGDGGSIRLVTQGLIGLAFRDRLTPESDITASSELGVNGTVQIESPNVDADGGLVQLPDNLEDTSNQVVAGCAAQSANQFASTGRGGLPGNPTAQFSGNRLWQDTRSLTSGGVVVSRNTGDENTEIELVEAQNWQVNAAGEVELMTASLLSHQANSCLEQKMAQRSDERS